MLAVVVVVAQIGAAAVATQSAAGHAARLAARGEPAEVIAATVRGEAGPTATVAVNTARNQITATVTRPIMGVTRWHLPHTMITAEATAHREPDPATIREAP